MAGDVAGGVLNPATRQGTLVPAESRVKPPSAQRFATQTFQDFREGRLDPRSQTSSQGDGRPSLQGTPSPFQITKEEDF